MKLFSYEKINHLNYKIMKQENIFKQFFFIEN